MGNKKGCVPWNKNLHGEDYLKHLKKGKIWNTGLTKETDERVKIYGLKGSISKKGHWIGEKNPLKKSKNRKKQSKRMMGENNPCYGKKPWNFNLTKETDERVKRYTENMKKTKSSKEFIIKLKEEIIPKIRLARKKQIFPKEHTKIENKIYDKLSQLSLMKDFKRNEFIGGFHRFDFVSRKFKIAIECDGDYWHANPKFFKELNKTQLHNRKNDEIKDRIAEMNGYKLLRFWERDIYDNMEECMTSVSDAINLEVIKTKISNYGGG